MTSEHYSITQNNTGEWEVLLYAPSGRLVRAYLLNSYELANDRAMDWVLFGNCGGELSAPMPDYLSDFTLDDYSNELNDFGEDY